MGENTLRVLVTGAGGFIGRRVMATLQPRLRSVDAFAGDVRDLATYDGRADVVLHLAALVRHDQFAAAPARGYDVNVVGTQGVLNYCRRVGARCVLASTSGIYRATTVATPVPESAAVEPLSPYAMSKWLAERLCEQQAKDAGVASVALRVFNVYGPGQHGAFLIPHVVHSLMEGRPIVLRMPEAIRDFVYVDDVAEAFYRAALLQARHGFCVFNVGSGCATRVRDMVEVAEHLFGPATRIETSRQHPGEPDAVVADTTQARRELGWAPQYDLVAGLQAMKAAMVH